MVVAEDVPGEGVSAALVFTAVFRRYECGLSMTFTSSDSFDMTDWLTEENMDNTSPRLASDVVEVC